jgi:hypothetical protein
MYISFMFTPWNWVSPNLYKVKREEEFNTREDALMWAGFYNQHRDNWNINGWLENGNGFEAVYYGKVNDATGELV